MRECRESRKSEVVVDSPSDSHDTDRVKLPIWFRVRQFIWVIVLTSDFSPGRECLSFRLRIPPDPDFRVGGRLGVIRVWPSLRRRHWIG